MHSLAYFILLFLMPSAATSATASYCDDLIWNSLKQDHLTDYYRQKISDRIKTLSEVQLEDFSEVEKKLSDRLANELCAVSEHTLKRENLADVSNYQGFSRLVNVMLRKLGKGLIPRVEVPLAVRLQIGNIDEAMLRSPAAPFDFVVYRGVRKIEATQFLEKGNLLPSYAFVSTSLRREVAEDFSVGCGYKHCDSNEGERPDYENSQLFEILVPKGTPMLMIHLFRYFYFDLDHGLEFFDSPQLFTEGEVLLPRNSALEIISVSRTTEPRSVGEIIKAKFVYPFPAL